MQLIEKIGILFVILIAVFLVTIDNNSTVSESKNKESYIIVMQVLAEKGVVMGMLAQPPEGAAQQIHLLSAETTEDYNFIRTLKSGDHILDAGEKWIKLDDGGQNGNR